MSNSLSTVERVELIPDVELSTTSTATMDATRARAEIVSEFGRGIAAAIRAVTGAFTWVDRRVDEAKAMRDLVQTNERMLADAGLSPRDLPLRGAGQPQRS